MDASDPDIAFDAAGICNHCRQYDEQAAIRTAPRDTDLSAGLVDQIKKVGKKKEYDCIIGVSGGVDSSYLAYTVKRLGLRPVAVHLDNGWDSELAVDNIERVVKRLGIDLVTRVLDWQEFRSLQVSFLKASVSDGEIPTDHAILATLYQEAARRGIHYVLSGDNFVTEAILPTSWTYGVADWRYIEQIHRQFSKTRLSTFPHVSRMRIEFYSRLQRIKIVRFLDYIPYVKGEAIKLLESELGWRPYSGKHFESIYTRFFQGYILPTKFDIQKRQAHLSTLICSGQLSRESALEALHTSEYTESQIEEDRVYVIKKLGLTEVEFDAIMTAPVRTFHDYPNHLNQPAYAFARRIKRLFAGKGVSIVQPRRTVDGAHGQLTRAAMNATGDLGMPGSPEQDDSA